MSDTKTGLNSGQLSFDDTEIAFRNKSSSDLNSAYWLFQIISSNFLTTIGPPVINWSLKLGLPLEPLIKKTVFKQFCGGETIAECEQVINQLAMGKVGTILDYAVEGEEREEVFDNTAEEIIRTIGRAKGDLRIPLTVFKPTGVARFGLLEKITARQELSSQETEELNKLEIRIDKICRIAYDAGVPVMIDAEETWIQDAVDELVLKMMRKYNRDRVAVCTTYQLYRRDMLTAIKRDVTRGREEGFMLGAKLVRGAYMEKERERARELEYPSPIQPDKEATDNQYDEACAYCVKNIDHVALIAGTHNEKSCRKLVEVMEAHNVPRDHKHIYFSQLLGMSDNLSFNLADAGYNVAKYVPYGPVKAVLPYLFRRAEENTSISGQTGRELRLIINEKKRRGLKESKV
ncbi:MAG TPA: proline dehydrogenase family protein [Sphingobacteriaceae bacterium]